MSHSSKTSKRNRATARNIKDEKGKQMFKGTKAARKAGLNLPTADEIADAAADATRQKVDPKFQPKKPGK